MTAEEFVRRLDAENQSLLGRLAPDDTLNLTAGFDYPPLFTAVETASPRPPVLAFTTHALASVTRPLHARCDRIISETLTQELPTLLKDGIAA
jgi:hypothetical protein